MKKYKPSTWQIIALGYIVVVLVGSLLLSMPIASRARVWTPYINTIFTATSATCVTGLVVYDTFTYWSLFGQLVILTLIQIGGLGFMTIISLFAIISKRQIGLYHRTILSRSARSISVSGVVRLIKRIIIGTLCFEFLGAVFLSIKFIPEMGFARGGYFAIFHAISAFCNAGFDLMGFKAPFSSLTSYYNDPLVSITIMMLIIIGGIGFLVWSDLWDCRCKIKKISWYSKIVIIATTILIVVPTVLFMIFENNNLLKDMNFGNSLLTSLFQSVTPRTAGFNSLEMTKLSDSSVLMTMFLMFVGGSSGSTAGGIKVTTFVVILYGLKAILNQNSGITLGRKRLEDGILKQALAIFTSYLISIFVAILILCAIEPLTLKDITFEVISAIGTVGLTMGITSQFSIASKLIITFLMYIGRVGLITIVLAFAQKRSKPPVQRPIGDILIG